MSSGFPNKYYKVGVLLFPGADILDFAGPIEVLSHVSHNRNPESPDRMFEIKTVACSPAIRAANSLTVHADLLLPDAVDEISEFHILVIPGGPPSVVQPLIENNTPELDLIRKFAALPADRSLGTRVLLSVCTGAFLLGAAGVLGAMTVATHHHALDRLRDICARSHAPDEPATTVLHQRYLDGGLLKGRGVRLLTAGGVSSGLDATFYLVSQLATPDMAAFIARVMEYDWRELTE
ncbi:DJ-1 domain, InhA-type [Penicillium expansum]|uniref:DJ-1 domain, InhA-type n=1 Tax=Penicillium expansum TaxID=27334 RepID=A0A0A2KA30_PENEN|nr:DJ-1 domain, InhA-type [Penicillium expansum]KGO40448.1 DJ-1 domain, InhA-type [Penicillium expansum]KGO59672.1 DJ-1 domain, InhA-type [Penicillium expansum]KGO64692.1 DJ-1 domain, InhA-type [Penicillium expansum]